MHTEPLAHSGARNGRPVDENPRSTDLVLADYLAGEVLGSLGDDERDLALALCVLDRFDPDLGVRLVGPGAAPVVRHLLGAGALLSVVDAPTGTMRFHALFRELMEAELAHHDPVTRLDLHRRAAVLAEERGDLPTARRHLAEIGAQFSLSVNTVKSNLKSIYRKLDATTRSEAVDAATAAGLL